MSGAKHMSQNDGFVLRNRPIRFCVDSGSKFRTLRARILGARGRVLAVTAPFDLGAGKISWPESGRRVLVDLNAGPLLDATREGAGSALIAATVLERRMQPFPLLLLEVADDIPVLAAGLRGSWGRIVVVTGGKGGTGKSITAVNLAYAASATGIRTVLLDADFRTGNVAVLTGIRPVAALGDVLRARAPLDRALVPWNDHAYILASPVQHEPRTDPSPWELARVAGLLDVLAQRFDLVIVDTGAGVGSTVTHLLLLADCAFVVTLNEPPALLDAYRLLKAAVLEGARTTYHLLINRVQDDDEARAAGYRFTGTAADHLRVRVRLAGLVPEDAAVRASVLRREPVVAAGASPAAAALRSIAGGFFGTGSLSAASG